MKKDVSDFLFECVCVRVGVSAGQASEGAESHRLGSPLDGQDLA